MATAESVLNLVRALKMQNMWAVGPQGATYIACSPPTFGGSGTDGRSDAIGWRVSAHALVSYSLREKTDRVSLLDSTRFSAGV